MNADPEHEQKKRDDAAVASGSGASAHLGVASIAAAVVSRSGTRTGTESTRHQSLKLDLCELPLTLETLAKSAIDAQTLAGAFDDEPETVLTALSHFRRGRLDRATAALAEIGISIDQLQKKGGGPWGLAILAAAALLLLLPSRIADEEPAEGPVEVTPETMTRLKELGIVGQGD